MTFSRILLLGVLICSGFTVNNYAQNVSLHSRLGNPVKRPHLTLPRSLQDPRTPHPGNLSFLASEEGRTFLKATGNPLAGYAIAAFGEPKGSYKWPVSSANAYHVPAFQKTSSQKGSCTTGDGVRFNLEPRANATLQNQAAADFIPNRIAPGVDLIVQGAQDGRADFVNHGWDESASGYYVHTSTKADCSVQFEGGLPTFSSQGSSWIGVGGTYIAADPERDAFFAVDLRFGSGNGVALFRASSTTLLNSTSCPAGTHSQAQATTCWEQTPPVLFTSFNANAPRVTVDERATNAGTGAGDVYLVADTPSIFLTACTNTLTCGQSVVVSGSDIGTEFPDIQVRSDGLITISYIVINHYGELGADIKFTTCTPAGAPNPPVCATPVRVVHVADNLAPNLVSDIELTNFNNTVWTFPKHADRTNSSNSFTTFLVYDDCKNMFVQSAANVCLDAEVTMTISSDNGKTWSTPVSVDPLIGHHFLPTITTDISTGIVNMTYYSAEGDRFDHAVRVFRNQINPGTTQLGSPQPITTVADTIDDSFTAVFMEDIFMGAKARGNGVSGQSRLYLSFDSALTPGVYESEPAPDGNNNLMVVSY